MPKSTIELQRIREGKFYNKKHLKRKKEKSHEVSYESIISYSQISTNMALGFLLIGVLNSVDAKNETQETLKIQTKLASEPGLIIVKKTKTNIFPTASPLHTTPDADNKIADKAPNRETSLLVAAEKGIIGDVKALIEAGANLNQPLNSGATPLFFAAQNGHLEVVEALIKAGANFNEAKKDGATPLFVAAQNGHLEVVKALIEAGANFNQPLNSGATPLFVAAKNGNTKIVKALIKAGVELDKPLNDDGITPLFEAIKNGHIKAVKALIKAGANIEIKAKGLTALSFAIKNNRSKIIKIINSLKSDPNKIDNVQHVEPEPPIAIKVQHVEDEPTTQSSNQSARDIGIATLAILAGATAISCGVFTYLQNPLGERKILEEKIREEQEIRAEEIRKEQEIRKKEEEIMTKASIILKPINDHLDKLHLFTSEEIEPIEWKMKDGKLVLELEHKLEYLKQAIIENFNDHIEPEIQQENPQKSIITLTPAFTQLVENSNEYSLQDLNFIRLQTIKNGLEAFCTDKFEQEYGQFFRGLDEVGIAEIKNLFRNYLCGEENASSFVKLQRLFNFGLTPSDLSEIVEMGLARTPSNEINYPEFYDDKIKEELESKFEKDGKEPRDSIHNNLRIGARLFSAEVGAEEYVYFVRFSTNPGNLALACKTERREVFFFEAVTNNRFEIVSLRTIDRREAERLFVTITTPATAPQMPNVNQFQNQGGANLEA